MERPASSSVNMGTGRLSHSQEVFTLSGSNPLPLSVSLYYNSIPFAPSSIGNGWSHSYEATLQAGAGGSMIFWNEGTRRVYNKHNTTYVPPKGDHSTLVKNADDTWTITELDGLKRNFDATYKLTSITDRYTNNSTTPSLSFGYNTDGKLTTVTDANGRAITFGYNGSGKLETITDPKGNAHTLVNPAGNLTEVIPPGDKGKWTYTYDPSNGLLKTKKDPADNTSTYTYYPSDIRIQNVTDPQLKPRSYTYPPTMGNAGKIPDCYPPIMVPQKTFYFAEKDGNDWTYTFDTLTKNVRTVTSPAPFSKTTTYYYNPDSTLRAITVPFDGTTKYTTFYTYDGNGNLLTQTDPADISNMGIDPQTVNIASLAIKSAVIYTYDTPANYYQIKTITDNRGTTPLTTTFDRYTESAGQGGTLLVTKVTAPGETAGSTLISYLRQYANGTIASLTDAGGKSITFTYYPVSSGNASGMLDTVTTPDGVKLTITAYDGNGNPTELKLIDADNTEIPVKTTQGYSALNRITSILMESTATPGRFLPNLTSYGYDNNDNLNSIIDAEYHETKYEYTYDRQVKKITNTVNGLLVDTMLEYGGTGCQSCNGVDKLTVVKDPNHVKNNLPGTVYQYDEAGRLKYETDPIGKRLLYTYYDNGLLKEKYDATNGDPGTLLTSYHYNNRGQLTEKDYPSDNPSGITSVKYTYTPNGWLETASNLAGSSVTFSYTYEYHNNGRLKNVTDSDGRKVSYDLYDSIGQKKQMTVLKGEGTDERVINYEYDDANRLWHIKTNGDTKTFTYSYDKRGRRDTLDYPNGTQAKWEYDDLDRLTAITHKVTGGATFASYSYPTHDQMGNVKDVYGGKYATYVYDEIYRLLSVVSNSPEAFTYDDAGNRLTGPGPVDISYLYNDANQITIGRKLDYEYDNRGNQTTRTVPGASDKTWTQIWDAENRLFKVVKEKTLADGTETKTVTFAYDPFGRRIEKVVEKKSYDVATQQYVTKKENYKYVYDNDDIVLELYANPADAEPEKTYFTHGPGIDEHLALERNGEFYYYHQDGLGSVVAITNGASTIVQSYGYDSFGMVTQTTPAPVRNSNTYAGRGWDKETGLLYARERYIDLMEGRFISKDPIGFAGGDVNLYGYVQSNPINWVDPEGLRQRSPYGEITAPSSLPRRIQDYFNTDLYSLLGKGPNSKVDVFMKYLPLLVSGAESGMLKAGGSCASSGGKELFNFSIKAAEHMENPARAVPIQILEQAIKEGKGIPDPRGSRALMYYAKMWKNETLYHLEVLYDKATNSIWHFKYFK